MQTFGSHEPFEAPNDASGPTDKEDSPPRARSSLRRHIKLNNNLTRKEQHYFQKIYKKKSHMPTVHSLGTLIEYLVPIILLFLTQN